MIPEPLPQPSPPAAGGARLIAVASGKGGVGKTWLAVTLSHALAMAGRRVLLVDADLGLANVDVQLGLEPAGGLARRPVRPAHRAGGGAAAHADRFGCPGGLLGVGRAGGAR